MLEEGDGGKDLLEEGGREMEGRVCWRREGGRWGEGFVGGGGEGEGGKGVWEEGGREMGLEEGNKKG